MDEKPATNHQARVLNEGSVSKSKAQSTARHWPSREERLAKICDYQAKALEHADPHTATLGILDGDVMLLALRIREVMETDLLEGSAMPESSRRLAQQAEMFFKCVRQIERNARIIQELNARPEDA